MQLVPCLLHRSSLTSSVGVRLSVFGNCQSAITEENSSSKSLMQVITMNMMFVLVPPSYTTDANRLELPKFEVGPLNRGEMQF